MSLVQSIKGKSLAVALALAMLPASVAVPQNMQSSAGSLISSLFGATAAKADPWRNSYRRGHQGGWNGGRNWDNRRYHNRNYNNRYYRNYNNGYYRNRNNDATAAIVGGIVGLGLGAAIANSYNQPRYVQPAPQYSYAPAPWSREWYQYCSQRYRSFDPQSGTFQPYNGQRRMCR
ncbi:BA14K family protein [Aureimonas fodinaquatilis]|nr:BA14K family protein [Aureimonas fodinaquatilis]